MRVAIANFTNPRRSDLDFRALWAAYRPPPPRPRQALFDHAVDWGFHIYALGLHMLERGLADHVEFWDYADERSTAYHPNGILRVLFHNADDVAAYVERFGAPDLYVNHGRTGAAIVRRLAGKSFRVHVPACRWDPAWPDDLAECYLIDHEDDLRERSMLYVPVVNTRKIAPGARSKVRDFVYLASVYAGKRHDIFIDAMRGMPWTGHLHPVNGAPLDLTGTRITTSGWNERDVPELLQTSRVAVYPADGSSSPAAMWECVAAGLPIVVNRNIAGGGHLVVPGVTGELASPDEFRDVMAHVLEHRGAYRPREHFEEHWDTVETLESYLAFFRTMGWEGPRCS